MIVPPMSCQLLILGLTIMGIRADFRNYSPKAGAR